MYVNSEHIAAHTCCQALAAQAQSSPEGARESLLAGVFRLRTGFGVARCWQTSIIGFLLSTSVSSCESFSDESVRNT